MISMFKRLRMKKVVALQIDRYVFVLLFITHFLFVEQPTWALVSLKSTVSTGFYRDAEQEAHTPTYFYWDFSHATQNKIETFLNFGVNNAVMEDWWRIYVYQAMLSIPLWQGFEEAPYRASRLQVGRQLFFEGFELGLLDGLQAPLYWSKSGGVTLAAGGINAVNTHKIKFDSQIYGGTVHETFWGALWKAGYFLNTQVRNAEQNLIESSVLKTWNHFFWHPMVFLRGQLNLPLTPWYQGAAELQWVPLETMTLNISSEVLRPNRIIPEDETFIYRMFATSTEKSYRFSTAWRPQKEFQTELGYRYITFESQAGDEDAHRIDYSVDTIISDFNVGGYVGYVTSYGGEVTHGGIKTLKSLGHTAKVRLEGSAAWIDKINQIQGWAYHGRGGMDFRLASRFIVSALAEIERNHLFDIDARAVFYVSHYYF